MFCAPIDNAHDSMMLDNAKCFAFMFTLVVRIINVVLVYYFCYKYCLAGCPAKQYLSKPPVVAESARVFHVPPEICPFKVWSAQSLDTCGVDVFRQ